MSGTVTSPRRGLPAPGTTWVGQVAALFTGFELVEPGLVPVGEWRPEPDGDPAELDNLAGLAGAGRKP